MSIRAVPVVLFGLGLAANVSAAETRYIVTDLGTLGGLYSYATDINNHGDIVGDSRLPVSGYEQPSHAFLYRNGVMTDLGTLGGYYSSAYAINNNAEVVGWSYSDVADADGDVQRAFRYAGGKMTDLGKLPGGSGYQFPVAYDINDQGQAVGDAGGHAVLYSNNSIVDIGTLGGPKNAQAYGINNNGQIAGDSTTGPFLYSAGTTTDLGTLGGAYSTVTGINNLGQVVGYSATAGNSSGTDTTIQHAFLYSNGNMTDLGSLGLWRADSWAIAINNKGSIVGFAQKLPNTLCAYEKCPTYPFVYSAGRMKDLNSLLSRSSAGWIVFYANGINDAGQIVGEGAFSGGNHHAVLLTPETRP